MLKLDGRDDVGVLWEVFAALVAGKRRAECLACGAIGPDPGLCSECGSSDLDEFTADVLNEAALRDELRGSPAEGSLDFALLAASSGLVPLPAAS